MRIFKQTFKQKITLRTATLFVSIALSVLAIPAAVLAWGPERATFTIEHPASYVAFNSITNNPSWGDERNFFRVRDVSTGASYDDDANLVAGKEYEAVIFYHNNANSALNAGGTGIAHGAYARAEMPAVVKAGSTGTTAEAFVGATNANPTSVYDYINLKNSSATDLSVRLVPGTVKYGSFGAHNNDVLSDTALFSSTGTPLGYDALDGNLPGCNQYSGLITFHFTAAQPSFTFKKDVRIAGTKTWTDTVTANHAAQVEYKLTYQNTGQTVQNDVTLKDVLPAGVTYVAGSTKLYTTSYPNGKVLTDEISQGGMNIGSYSPGGGAYLVFAATVNGAPCTTVTNTAYAVTNNGNQQDTSGVTVAGQCTLPTTGPVEIVAGLVGVAAITLGVVYFFRSRRDLESAIHDAQTRTHHSHSDNLMLTSAPDTKVEADQHHKSEHPHSK